MGTYLLRPLLAAGEHRDTRGSQRGPGAGWHGIMSLWISPIHKPSLLVEDWHCLVLSPGHS